MKLLYDCVVKTAKNKDGVILWQSIYVDNKKQVENYKINLNEALKYYAPNKLWKEEIIITDEDVYSYLDDYFPELEDFTYLLDCTEIFHGKTVYLLNGVNVVDKIWNDYRPAGKCDRWHWEEIDGKWYCAKFVQYLQAHDIIKFTVEGSDEEYIWEDWTYHQSFLYLNSIQ